MRHFHSYGPVDPDLHYCVKRTELITRCVEQLVGSPDKGGHYFTIWAARQTGKTWLMRRAVEEIRAHHGDRFLIGAMSMQGVDLEDKDPPDKILKYVPDLFERFLKVQVAQPAEFVDFAKVFRRESAVFDRPVILLIDEFDRLPRGAIDALISQFRDLFLDRENNLLHSLALIGVRAVLGVDSPRGSPFNVQRSLQVPNLTLEEVTQMFQQYEEEHGQKVEPALINTLYEMTRGQPGLVGWFGELLTEKYYPGPGKPLGMDTWPRVYAAACQVEPNNTMLNLLKKATGPHLDRVLEIFGREDVPFSFGQEWCNFLYLNGIIDPHETVDGRGQPLNVCRFSSPFVQQRLFSDLSFAVLHREHDLPLDPLDTLADVFTPAGIDLPALLGRYVAYLGRLQAQGHDPWKGQPLRADLRHTEAVAHFHLHAWLCRAVPVEALVSPEFPTGNGTVDLVLRWEDHKGVIEVKSFVNQSLLRKGQEQAAGYARRLSLAEATLAVFVPVSDRTVLEKLSGARQIGGVTVHTVAISSAPAM